MEKRYGFSMDVRKLVDEKYEEYLREQFPDPRRRAVARFVLGVQQKCAAHLLITGREPTEEEIEAYFNGAELPGFEDRG
jgi:hypothetical protein